MSTKYQPRITPRNSPPWCKPGMFPSPFVDDGQLPPTAVVSAFWFDTTTVPVAQLAEYVRVEWNAGLNGWSGASGGPGYALSVEVIKTGTANVYDVNLYLTYQGSAVDDESWHDVPIPPFPNFDSGPLTHIYNHPDDANGVWVTS